MFFLNYVRIRPDDKHKFIFCAPDVPHAYLSGNCVECMALSDNVVRAGFHLLVVVHLFFLVCCLEFILLFSFVWSLFCCFGLFGVYLVLLAFGILSVDYFGVLLP